MSKKMILTISDSVDKYLKDKAFILGMTELDYIRFIIMKQKEQDESSNLGLSLG